MTNDNNALKKPRNARPRVGIIVAAGVLVCAAGWVAVRKWTAPPPEQTQREPRELERPLTKERLLELLKQKQEQRRQENRERD